MKRAFQKWQWNLQKRQILKFKYPTKNCGQMWRKFDMIWQACGAALRAGWSASSSAVSPRMSCREYETARRRLIFFFFCGLCIGMSALERLVVAAWESTAMTRAICFSHRREFSQLKHVVMCTPKKAASWSSKHFYRTSSSIWLPTERGGVCAHFSVHTHNVWERFFTILKPHYIYLVIVFCFVFFNIPI